MALTPAQQVHVEAAFPECRAELADYLERGVEVIVFRQTECGDDVPLFAVAPKTRQDFWLGCWDTEEMAVSCAAALGLRLAHRGNDLHGCAGPFL